MDRITFDLSDRTAIVTGASSGIGRHLCLALARSGARVVAGARRTEMLNTLTQEIKELGGEAIAVEMDVTKADSVKVAFDAGEKAFGLINTVYCNAGIYAVGSVLELPIEELERVYATNLHGTVLTAREAASRLIAAPNAAQRGRIIITSSIRAETPTVNHLAYCSSKAAIIMAGKIMAKEWAETGINVNIVAPGVLITDINAWFYETDEGKRQLAANPRNRAMSTNDLTETFLYLGSDLSAAVTGSVFTLDDGQLLK